MKINSDVLRGKNALVIGVNGGFGLAIAQELAGQGCSVIATSRNASKLTESFTEQKNLKVRVEAIPCDLSDKQAVSALVMLAQQLIPQIYVLINCAGISPVCSVSDATLDGFELCLAVSVRAPLQHSKVLLPQMKAKSWGRIVNIGSRSAFNGFEDTAIYCASKHALLGFSARYTTKCECRVFGSFLSIRATFAPRWGRRSGDKSSRLSSIRWKSRSTLFSRSPLIPSWPARKSC